MLLAPLRWQGESSHPDSLLCFLGLRFLGRIEPGETVGDGPALPHHPRIDVGAVRQGAYCKRSLVAIESSAAAGELPTANVRSELIAGCSAARPRLSTCISACLFRLRCVDALQPDTGSGDLDGIAVDHPRFAYDCSRRGGVRAFVGVKCEHARREHHAHKNSSRLSVGARRGNMGARGAISSCHSIHPSGHVTGR